MLRGYRLGVDQVRWVRKAELRRPIMVVAFEGWNDAGEAASLTVDHLAAVWDAEAVATIESEDFYDFTVARPEIALSGRERQILWPDPEILSARVPGSEHDLVLVRGIEPHMRWRAFTGAVLEAAAVLKVESVMLLGALLADVPHTRPTRVSGASDDAELTAQLRLTSSSYEGPTGIVGVLYDSLRRAGYPAGSLWAAVPHYAHQLPSPKAIMALLDRLSDLLGTPIDPLELADAAAEYEQEVDEQISDDPDTVAYVAELEQAEDAEPRHPGGGPGGAYPDPATSGGSWIPSEPLEDLGLAEGDRLADEAEKYLREHRSGG